MKRSKPEAANKHCQRSICPVACTLDIVGDKWTLLVVRDLFMAKNTYSEFQKSPEKIPTNILANRLKRLLHYEMIDKTAYQKRPVRYAYTLTDKGKSLWPLIKEIMQWGNQNIPETWDASKILKKIESGEY